MSAIKMKTLHKAFLMSVSVAALSSLAPYAFAQVENATGIADPSRITDELLARDELPALSGEVQVESKNFAEAPSGAENIHFTLNSLQIDGVSAYTSEDLDPVYRDKLGQEVSLAEVYGIAAALTRKYRNEGYLLSSVGVPHQTIEGGHVKLKVVEGFVDEIIIQGDVGENLKKQIMKYADNLRTDGIVDSEELQRYLLLMNDIPGLKVRGIIDEANRKVDGAVDLVIVAELDKYEGEVSLDNFGSRYLGPYQGKLTGSINSPFGGTESITTQLVMAGDKNEADELLFGAVTYEQLLSRFGSKIQLQAGTTATEPGDDLDQFDVKGHARFFSATISHPFIRSRTTNFTGRATFDMRSSESKNDLEANNREDRLRSVRLGSTVQFMDTLFGVGLNAFDVQASQGIEFLGGSSRGDANLTRANGNPHYTKIEAQAQRMQRLTSDLNLLLVTQGQWASTPLLSAEEFGVGGSIIGRGYDSSEIVGEDGISGKVELQWNSPYEIKYIDDYQLYGFWDAGRVWNQDATTSAAKRESLASTGFGVIADIDDKTTAGLGVAFPLTRDVDTTGDRGPKYFFSLKREF